MFVRRRASVGNGRVFDGLCQVLLLGDMGVEESCETDDKTIKQTFSKPLWKINVVWLATPFTYRVSWNVQCYMRQYVCDWKIFFILGFIVCYVIKLHTDSAWSL